MTYLESDVKPPSASSLSKVSLSISSVVQARSPMSLDSDKEGIYPVSPE